MRKYAAWLAAAALSVAAASGTAAQQKEAQPKGAEPSEQGQCDLKTSHFAVNRAVLYLQNASNSQDSTKKQQALDGAQRSLLEAIGAGQDQNPVAWYYLGYYYTLAGDAVGADSSFDRVESIMPGCASDVEQYRQVVWAKVANQGIEAMRDNDYAKAKELFATANLVFDKDPTASFYLGTVYATEDNADSAVRYFKIAAAVSESDTAAKEMHEKATQNVARIYQVLEQWDSAQVYFRAYRKLRPDDPESLTGLATAYLSGGDTASAVALYDSVLGNPDAMDPLDLFRIGVSLFRAERPERAATAFEAGLKRNPNYRNGLFNLTNAYFSMAQATQKPDSVKYYAGKMLAPGRRLAALDPNNRQVWQLIAAAYQLTGKDDSTDIILKKVSDMKFEVDVQVSRASGDGYEVQGTISNLGKTPTQVPTITFEFLGADGNVVTSQTVAAQTIEPSGQKQFQLTPATPGIVAWRYKVS